MMDLLVDLALKATLLCLAAAVLTAAMRRASAASRHLVWTGLFIAVLFLPIARVLLPTLPVFVLAPTAQPHVTLPPETATITAQAPVAVVPPLRTVVSRPSEPGPIASVTVPSPPSAMTTPITMAQVGTVLWLGGFVILLARLGIGRIRVRRLGRRARLLTDGLAFDRVEQLRDQFSVGRPIALCTSADEWMPMTWGVLRPVILVPASALLPAATADQTLEPMLVHEVAHVARFDAVADGIARCAVATAWFHPLIWLAAHEARLERERACDDAVLATGSKASAYADQLVALAQMVAPEPGESHALAMARRSQLERRVRSILNARANRQQASRASHWVAAALVILAIPGAAVRLTARTATPDPDAVITFAAPAPAPVNPASVTMQMSQRPSTVVPATVQTPVAGVVAPRNVEPLTNELNPQVGAQAPDQPIGPGAQPVAPANYLIGAEDVLVVTVWRAPEVSREVRVKPDGTIRLPMGNDIRVAGQTTEQAKATISAELTRFYTQPDVFVQVKEINSRAVQVPAAPPTYVIGANDVLRITVVGAPDLSGDVRVEADGSIKLPRGYSFAAAGWTASGLKDAMTVELKRCCLPSPEVVVQLVQINRSRTFFFFNEPLPPGQTMESMMATARGNEWDFMVATLRLRAAKMEHDIATKIEIGTTAPSDQAEFRGVTQSLNALPAWSHPPTNAEMAALRGRFTDAVRNLDTVQIRFDNGLVTIRQMADAFLAAANALKEPTPTLLSDSDLLAALKTAALFHPDAARADRLIELAQRHAFTPEMVTLYVAAANDIASDTDKARVFAQAIRVKGR